LGVLILKIYIEKSLNLEIMKKIISLLILGCFILYGFSINPIDPPAKKGEPVKTITQPAPVATKDCSESRSMVYCDAYISITDCPDYECDYPFGCSFEICIYDEHDTQLDCKTFDSETCSYTFEDIMAEEGELLQSKLVTPGCGSCYNGDFNDASNIVPLGGGNVYINQTFCCY